MKSAIALGLLGASLQAAAHPHPHNADKRGVAPGAIDLSQHGFEAAGANYQSNAATKTNSILKKVKRGTTYVETAEDLVKKVAPHAQYRLTDDHYVGSNGIGHAHFKQLVNGIEVINSHFNVNIDRDGNVFSFGNSFAPHQNEATFAKEAKVEPHQAVRTAINSLNLPLGGAAFATAEALDDDEIDSYKFPGISGAAADPTARLRYFKKADGTLALAWEVETDMSTNWVFTYVDAATGKEILGAHNRVMNQVADATYEVYPFGQNEPPAGPRKAITNPWILEASPNGWHSETGKLKGNNGYTGVDFTTNQGSSFKSQVDDADQDFEYPFTLNMTNPDAYVEASEVQLFYTANSYHDLVYTLGFDEAAGNYQDDNLGNGGKAGDPVVLSVRDTFTTNNAAFREAPDGSKGAMFCAMFDTTTPQRDSVMASEVILHEFTHGVSTRLTGGPSNPGCLPNGEAGGMGEGWSDAFALVIDTTPEQTRSDDVFMGAWIIADPAGIRTVPYSTDMDKAPNTYETINSKNEVHDIGETWTLMLNEVAWNLFDKHGHGEDFEPVLEDGVPTDGRWLWIKLMMDGMALQPCNPNFVEARDAIVDAEKALTNGDNACEIWKGFAKRGLGQGAKWAAGNNRVDSFDVPEGC